MGLFEGNVTYLYFKGRDPIPENCRELWLPKLKFYAFKPLNPASDLDAAFGWVDPMNILDGELSWDKLIWGEYLLLGLRIDSLLIPSLLLKAYISDAQRKYKEQKGKEYLSKYEMTEVRTVVTRELRSKALPSPRVIDMAWNLKENKLYLGTTAKKSVSIFMDLFEKTFSMRLIESGNPYSLSTECGLSEAMLETFVQLTPSNFVR